MLRFFRQYIKAIIWVIILSFALWGAGTLTLSKDPQGSYAGSIGGEKISLKEYLLTSRFYEMLMRSQEEQQQTKPVVAADEIEKQDDLPDDVPEKASEEETEVSAEAVPEPSLPPPGPTLFERVRSLTWQTLVLSREAALENVTVTDEEVRVEVQRLFSAEGEFDHAFYQTWIRNNFRERPREFEEVVRKHIAALKLRDQMLKGVPEEEQDGRWLAKLVTLMNRVKVEDYTASTEPTA